MSQKSIQLPGSVRVVKEADLLYDDLAEALMACGLEAVRERGTFHLALSGGSTPEPFYRRLVIDPRFRLVPWEKTHFWMVDERRVPESDPKNNFRMIRETLIDHVPSRKRNIHPMPVAADDPAGEYEQLLRSVFGQQEPGGSEAGAAPRLDFVLLGMGDDGHTASLFPRSPALSVTDRLVATNDGPAVTPPPRITMTFPLLNAAREVAVLVVGGKKTATLRRVEAVTRSGGADVVNIPITGIQPAEGALTWWVDAEAVGS